MLSIKQEDIKYHFLSLWYNSTWGWTLVSWTIGKHSNYYANGPESWGDEELKMIYILGKEKTDMWLQKKNPTKHLFFMFSLSNQ